MATKPSRRAAVLLLLLDKQGETHVVLTKRTDRVAYHKSQISLPGGTVQDSDPSLLHTALRETQEELGIAPEQIEILGQLSVVDTVSTNFDVTPFVGRLISPPSYEPNPMEVAEVLEVPLSALRDPHNSWEEDKMYPGKGMRRGYFFRYGDHIIWGATARMLKEYLEKSDTFTTGAGTSP